jgi:hypothetical protein
MPGSRPTPAADIDKFDPRRKVIAIALGLLVDPISGQVFINTFKSDFPAHPAPQVIVHGIEEIFFNWAKPFQNFPCPEGGRLADRRILPET